MNNKKNVKYYEDLTQQELADFVLGIDSDKLPDEIIYRSTEDRYNFEDVLNMIFMDKGEDDLNWFLSHLIGEGYGFKMSYQRGEKKFFSLLKEMVDKVNIEQQRQILNYWVDGFIEEVHEMSDENGNTIIHKTCVILEYDEKHHNNSQSIVKDFDRKKDIINNLLSKYEAIEFIRIPEDYSYKALAYLVPYLNGLETSYSVDVLSSFCEFDIYEEFLK